MTMAATMREIGARTVPASPMGFAQAIAPLVDRLVDAQCAATPEPARAEVRAYVLATVAAMPDYFRLGFRLLAWLFEFSPLMRGKGRFSGLDRTLQAEHVARWQGSILPPLRAMIAFYASFAAYGLYSVTYPAPVEEPGRIAA